jgi:retron-type reverse transcriptase
MGKEQELIVITRALEPLFELSFIFDSYACRKGKGTHAAADRCQQFARRYRYVLKADVRKFFPSIDHQILKTLIGRKIKDPDVVSLIGLIIDHSNPQGPVLMWFPGDDLFTPTERRRGLPLGNQTSQFFANVYLDPLDHLVCDRLGLSYVRYVDDFLIFADDKQQLHDARKEVERFLETLRLRIHQDKSAVFPSEQGIRFLGYRVFPTHRLLAQENVRRFRRRMRRMQREFAAGRLGFDAIRPRILSWIGHARHANTYRLRSDLLRKW